MATNDVDYLVATTPQGPSGTLTRTSLGYAFRYEARMNPAAQLALNMPHRLDVYASESLFPIFEMNLPEGYVLEELRRRFAKVGRMDPMLLLALTGQDASIGRIALHAPAFDSGTDEGVSLASILAWNGAEDLFQSLSDRYLRRTGISGVQPKLLVPEKMEAAVHAKGLVRTRDLIVKSAGDRFPGLAVNEFVCMSIARQAGLPVPEFFLSDNRSLFVMRRFDRQEDGTPIGFEDMAVLMGKPAADKYRGSYGQVARAIGLYCHPDFQRSSWDQLFDQVMLSCMLGNGDAHLKNFGVLYSDPVEADVRLAPAYDIVNTTHYIAEDSLALSLNGSKNIFTARLEIEAFAGQCSVGNPRQRIAALVNACEIVFAELGDLLATEPGLEAAMRTGVTLFNQHIPHLRH